MRSNHLIIVNKCQKHTIPSNLQAKMDTALNRKSAGLVPVFVPPPQLHIAANRLEHLVELNNEVPEVHGSHISIICTLGPACNNVAILEQMIEQGMTLARINMSHGNQDINAEMVKNLRQAARQYSAKVGYDVLIGVGMDTKGPEIRTGKMDPRGATHLPVMEGDKLSLTILPEFAEKGSAEIMFVDYANIVNMVSPGDTIFLDDGYITLSVKEVSGDTVRCNIQEGGVISAYRNVVIASKPIDLPTIGEVDKLDLKFAMEQEMDFVFVSYILDESILGEIRRILGERGKHIKLISKIDNLMALQNFDSILEHTDGVMVMRASLGLVLSPVKVMLAQKMIAAKCRRAWKPVIAATQLLVSMINSSRPKRVEVFDMGNAIMDGMDGLMFAAATATGSFPVECVNIVQRISAQTRSLAWARSYLQDFRLTMSSPTDNRSATLVAIMEAAIQCEATAILVIGARAKTANLLSSFRPHCPIVAVVQSKVAARQCTIYGAVHTIIYKHGSVVDWFEDTDDDRMDAGLEYCRKRTFIDSGKPVLVVIEAKQGYSCTIRVLNTW